MKMKTRRTEVGQVGVAGDYRPQAEHSGRLSISINSRYRFAAAINAAQPVSQSINQS